MAKLTGKKIARLQRENNALLRRLVVALEILGVGRRPSIVPDEAVARELRRIGESMLNPPLENRQPDEAAQRAASLRATNAAFIAQLSKIGEATLNKAATRKAHTDSPAERVRARIRARQDRGRRGPIRDSGGLGR